MTPLPEKDRVLEAVVMIREALNILSDEIAERDRRFQKIMRAVMDARREDDEAAMNQGQDCGALRPIAPGFEARTHAFAEIQRSGGMCCDDDPPSRDP